MAIDVSVRNGKIGGFIRALPPVAPLSQPAASAQSHQILSSCFKRVLAKVFLITNKCFNHKQMLEKFVGNRRKAPVSSSVDR